jgi:4'-phosphopantetheinyl transferase
MSVQIFGSRRQAAPKVNMQASEVQVWSASPNDFGAADCAALAAMLDAQELGSLERLRNDADRHAYLVAHALRRMAIGQVLDVAPAELRFSSDSQGKPHLAWPRETGLFFSHAHAREAVACVVTRQADVGVDVEHMHGPPDFSLLERFMVLPADDHDARHAPPRFFFYWTALEAFWKAHGVGLSTAHPRIRLREAGEGIHQAAFEHDSEGVLRARLVRLPDRSGCAVTFAVRAAHPDERPEPIERDAGSTFHGARDVSSPMTGLLRWPRRNVL